MTTTPTSREIRVFLSSTFQDSIAATANTTSYFMIVSFAFSLF